MTHFVLMKYKDGYLTNAKFSELETAFHALCGAVEGVSDCCVKRNAVERDANMDMLVSFRLPGPEVLKEYLTHPFHLKIAKENDPYVEKRVSFDFE